MSNIHSPFENISDSACWVAIFRAMETERPDAHFRDPFARILAGERGEQIVRTVRGEKVNAWSLAVRTSVIDELILQSIEKEGVDTVLNLAAGLDTRPYRLSLPSSLRWIEVDLPAILSYKEQKLANEAPACFLELVKLDLTDISSRNALFSRVSAASKQVLVITEGLLVYLTPAQVASLATDLHAQSNFRWWLFDLVSPFVLKQLQRRWNKYLAAGNAVMQFAPQEGTEFFQCYNWRVAEFRSTLEEARRLKREPPFAWFLRLLAFVASSTRRKRRESFYESAGIVLLEQV